MLKEAKRHAAPYLLNEGTVTVTLKDGVYSVYLGETVESMEALCKDRGMELFVIRNSDKKAPKDIPVNIEEPKSKKKKDEKN